MAYKRKSDQAVAAGRHYDRNKGRIKARARLHTAIERSRVRSYVTGFLCTHACLRCGEADPIVLEFHHRERAAKRFNIADGLKGSYALATVIEEIDKCDVLCANCHRLVTYEERKLLGNGKQEKVTPASPQLWLFD